MLLTAGLLCAHVGKNDKNQKFSQKNVCIVCSTFCAWLHIQQQQPFYGSLSGTTRVSRYQKKHPPTHPPDHHPIFISFFLLPRSIASSLFKLRAWQSFCTTSFHVLFGLRLGLEPSTSYSTFLHPISVFFSQHMPIPSQPVFAVESILYHLFYLLDFTYRSQSQWFKVIFFWK